MGKTFVGAEKAISLGASILCVCQKSKIDDWTEHFNLYYEWPVFDLTDTKNIKDFLNSKKAVGVINYDILFRREELEKIKDFTLLLDESSLISNEKTKRARFILRKLEPDNVILLSGTPTNGKYEQLWSQLHLLGWDISKDTYWKQYIVTQNLYRGQGFPIKVVRGYKNVERLKNKMREHGCQFLKTEEVHDLPAQNFQNVMVAKPAKYSEFLKKRIINIESEELVGDTILTFSLYARMLCGAYSEEKLKALQDLLESSDERFIIFYNFKKELKKIEDLCISLDRPVSIINGQTKDLSCYEQYNNAITLVQYQAGAMGLNLQKSNRIIYFTLPWGKGSCGMWEQSKKRIHRIGQERACFYYTLLCRETIEGKNLEALQHGKELTDELFKEAYM